MDPGQKKVLAGVFGLLIVVLAWRLWSSRPGPESTAQAPKNPPATRLKTAPE